MFYLDIKITFFIPLYPNSRIDLRDNIRFVNYDEFSHIYIMFLKNNSYDI